MFSPFLMSTINGYFTLLIRDQTKKILVGLTIIYIIQQNSGKILRNKKLAAHSQEITASK